MPIESIEALGLPIKEFKAGEALLEEGELSSSIYILIEGEVRVISEDVELLSDNSYGSFWGEMSVLLHGPVNATVEAVKDSRLYHIDHADDFMRNHSELWYSISRVMASRMLKQNKLIVELQHRLHHPEKNPHVHYNKLYQWMVLTNDFFDRDILHPFTKTSKQSNDEIEFQSEDR